ncbi:MAG: AAA family ATPase, partial [Clostridiales bacterium]|nr:AAA family ATPase [Clostridiales bacterium]
MSWQQNGALMILLAILIVLAAALLFSGAKKRGAAGCPEAARQKHNYKEAERLQKMRSVSLSPPLSEKTRPRGFGEVIGQADGIRALKAALCGSNPQHVIIYGPPGVGKTAAARLVLEEAKSSPGSPFAYNAGFVEVDGAISRFDERGIADPLIGSVHDPIYQGAGVLGQAGVPQPKLGAVSRAHGGILFIDEIGELHPMQINKLLKVLEERKVMLESAYYNPEDEAIPPHIHDIFTKGAPADFRLIAATTRAREEIPAAVRSRCLEIFFRGLLPHETESIARNAVCKLGMGIEEEALRLIGQYAGNGREAVNMAQLAAGLAASETGGVITRAQMEWVVNSGHYLPRLSKKIPPAPQIGLVNGLAVMGPDLGTFLDMEVCLTKSPHGRLTVTGIVEEQEYKS